MIKKIIWEQLQNTLCNDYDKPLGNYFEKS